MVGNYSPKKLARTKQIGNRGLGFRSILSWTHSPLVISGDLRLAFSRSLSTAILDSLVSQNEQLRVIVEEWQRGGHETPIPILACPAVAGGGGRFEATGLSEPVHRMWQRALALREQYDTVIALPFSEAGASEQVLAQIESLNQELMLFLQYLRELIIETEDNKKTWRANREQDKVTVASELEQAEPTRWRIHHRSGLVPEGNLSPSERSRGAFEIKIAVPDRGTGPGTLFNYFPTKVRFPYPVVAHATMELTSNRQNLITSDANRYLTERLAEALADVAEKSEHAQDPWRPLGLLATKGGSTDPILEELGFCAALRETARTKRVVPRRDGGMAEAACVKRMPVDAEGWLPHEEFGDLVLWTNNRWLKTALDWLGVPALAREDFRARAERVSPGLTLTARAAFVAGILQSQGSHFLSTDTAPALLIDGGGDIIGLDTIAYFPATGEMSFAPPVWMPPRFVSVELVDELARARGCSRERLVEELRTAGYKQVRAYDFGGVASALVAHANRRCRESPGQEAQIRREALRALRDLLESVPEFERRKRDPGLGVLVPTRQDEWKNADELYLGEPYPRGTAMEALLGELHPEAFVGAPEAIDGGGDASGWQPVLAWLGVSEHPREQSVELSAWKNENYLQHVRERVRYPIQFGEFRATGPDDLDLGSVRVTSIQSLEEILEKSDCHAILGWIALDPRFERWQREGDSGTRIDARFKVQTYRSSHGHPLPSYVLWALRERAWLPTTAGETCPPSRCLLVKTISSGLQEVLPCPEIDPEHPILQRTGVDRQTLTRALVLVGVRMTLDDLSWAQCYRLMLDLPEADPDGKAATRIYRFVSAKEEHQTLGRELQTLQDRFKQSGRIWACTKGQWGYVGVNDGVYFAADATLPKPVVDAFPMIDLPRGRGTDKVARVFGVRVLRSQDVSFQMTSQAETPNWEVLNDEVRRLKPYVLALRLDSTPEVTGIGLFKKLSLIACTWLEGKGVVNGIDVPFRLSEEGQALVHDDRAYLLVSALEREPGLDSVVLARRVASVLAAVLQVERASDFAQLAIARNPRDRETLLTEILGHDCSEVLQKAREVLQASESDTEQPWPVDLAPVRATATEQKRDEEPKAVSTADQAPSQAPVDLVGEVPTEVETNETPQEPFSPKRRIAWRVHAKRSSKDRAVQARRVTDGDRCEELAERFEESQGRFPLKVSVFQGTQGFGCDLLSFDSPTDRTEFERENGRPLSLVRRFIEVKGRSSARGSVPLAGNEKNAAREYGRRYYIYRVYEAEAGRNWRVVELADPLAYEWDVSYEVDLFRCPDSKYWNVDAVEPAAEETEHAEDQHGSE